MVSFDSSGPWLYHFYQVRRGRGKKNWAVTQVSPSCAPTFATMKSFNFNNIDRCKGAARLWVLVKDLINPLSIGVEFSSEKEALAPRLDRKDKETVLQRVLERIEEYESASDPIITELNAGVLEEFRRHLGDIITGVRWLGAFVTDVDLSLILEKDLNLAFERVYKDDTNRDRAPQERLARKLKARKLLMDHVRSAALRIGRAMPGDTDEFHRATTPKGSALINLRIPISQASITLIGEQQKEEESSAGAVSGHCPMATLWVVKLIVAHLHERIRGDLLIKAKGKLDERAEKGRAGKGGPERQGSMKLNQRLTCDALCWLGIVAMSTIVNRPNEVLEHLCHADAVFGARVDGSTVEVPLLALAAMPLEVADSVRTYRLTTGKGKGMDETVVLTLDALPPSLRPLSLPHVMRFVMRLLLFIDFQGNVGKSSKAGVQLYDPAASPPMHVFVHHSSEDNAVKPVIADTLNDWFKTRTPPELTPGFTGYGPRYAVGTEMVACGAHTDLNLRRPLRILTFGHKERSQMIENTYNRPLDTPAHRFLCVPVPVPPPAKRKQARRVDGSGSGSE